MPVLAGVARADRAAVLDDVRQDHDLGVARLLKGAGDIDLERSERRRKRLELRRVERLGWKAQHAVLSERLQDDAEFRSVERLREVDPGNGRPERLACRHDLDHRFILHTEPPVAASV